jgi:hypothetical protein
MGDFWDYLRQIEDKTTYYIKKSKAVPLQAWSGPEGSRKLRFPDFMTTAQGGSRVNSLTQRPPLPPGNTPGTHFCWRPGRPQGHSATGRIMSLKNSSDTIGNRTRDLPVCSVITLRTTPPRAAYYINTSTKQIIKIKNAITICHILKVLNRIDFDLMSWSTDYS